MDPKAAETPTHPLTDAARPRVRSQVLITTTDAFQGLPFPPTLGAHCTVLQHSTALQTLSAASPSWLSTSLPSSRARPLTANTLHSLVSFTSRFIRVDGVEQEFFLLRIQHRRRIC